MAIWWEGSALSWRNVMSLVCRMWSIRSSAMTLTDDPMRELVRRFVALDMTGWDDAAFDRALAHLGWSPAKDSAEGWRPKGEWFDTDLGTGSGTFSRHGADDDQTGIRVRVGDGDEVFRKVRAALEEELGAPTVMRGPGPLLRWRGPVRLLELERFSGTTYLEVKPAEGVENSEYRTAKWAEPEDGLGVLGYWQIVGRVPEAEGMSIPGGYWADGWKEFEDRLTTTLWSVVEDFALMDGPDDFITVVQTPGDCFVQWCTLSGWSLRIEARILSERDAAWTDAMTALGWEVADVPATEPTVAHEFGTLGRDEAATAARMLVGALQAGGVAFEDLWHQVIAPDVDLLGIGIPTRHGDRF